MPTPRTRFFVRAGLCSDCSSLLLLNLQPVIAFVSVKHLPYGGQSGVHAVVVNGIEKNRVSFIDPARGEEITVEQDTFVKAWQARNCLGLLIEP